MKSLREWRESSAFGVRVASVVMLEELEVFDDIYPGFIFIIYQ